MQLSCKSQTQNELKFKVKYNPETNYNQTIEQTSSSSIDYNGSEDFLKKIKEKGIENPTITNTNSHIESVFKTGKLTDGTSFPLTVEFVKMERSDGKKLVPVGTLIYGHGSIENMPTLDSIVSKGLDETFKKTLLQTMQSTFSQLSFPEKKVRVGESFSTESPLSIPIAGNVLEMTIITSYKLLSIINGIADFDISESYKMNTNISKYTIDGTGTGNGKIIYDISNNFYLKYQLNTDMTMNTKLDNFGLIVNTKSGIVQTTKITKNASR